MPTNESLGVAPVLRQTPQRIGKRRVADAFGGSFERAGAA